jgi:superfamily II DNA or RNA helicase
MPPGFQFLPDSKFLEKSEFQEAMMDAIVARGKENAIIVAPCGCGKSAVIIEALMEAGTLGLILCYESQGVYQMREAIEKNTTINTSQLLVYSGSTRDELPSPPPNRFCYLITTYGMVAESEARRNEESERVRNFVRNTKWNLVCCDEFHHAGATTYRPLVEGLAKTAEQVLGFTATLYRSEHSSGSKLSMREEEEAFRWFGPVAYRTTCKDLENAGLIAKIERGIVECDFTPEFEKAYLMANGVQKTYLAALNPAKLNALVAVCRMHRSMNHAGIVFVNHLIVADVAKECLGDGWAVLSGGAVHGKREQHTPLQNNEIVKQFNNGKLDGMICTAVGESSMDVHVRNFCFVCVLEADSGIASAGQRIGRIARSERINAEDAESPEQVRRRRLREQKQAVYYDFVTRNTVDMRAADDRHRLFAIEGYDRFNSHDCANLVAGAAREGVELPYTNLDASLPLLKRVLMYVSLGKACAEASASAASNSEEARRLVQKRKDAASNARHLLFRNQARKQLPSLKLNLKRKKEESRAIEHDQICNLPMDAVTKEIFQTLSVPVDTLAGAGFFSDVWRDSSDDEEEDP